MNDGEAGFPSYLLAKTFEKWNLGQTYNTGLLIESNRVQFAWIGCNTTLPAKLKTLTTEQYVAIMSKWDKVLDVNLTGPFLCMRRFATAVVESGEPSSVAVQMSSISRAGNMGQSNYSATKAALVAETVVWAKELARYGVRVGAIAPGFIGTPMVRSMRPDVLEKVLKPVPLRRLGEPEEVWEAVRFIIVCDYFTGRVIEVDGGLRL